MRILIFSEGGQFPNPAFLHKLCFSFCGCFQLAYVNSITWGENIQASWVTIVMTIPNFIYKVFETLYCIILQAAAMDWEGT